MSELSKKKCIPCSGDIPPFTAEQIKTFMTKVKDWECKKNDKGHFYLSKDFKFEDFEKSLNFINQVSQIAEDENHHPDLKFGWGYANINISTHAINGLAESDFVLAAKIDEISV
mgnify:CR=1 FL=1|tara:strand:- start:829 stop:1170 length:342 start_codon:yes stop_codon:yes gene_type:complete